MSTYIHVVDNSILFEARYVVGYFSMTKLRIPIFTSKFKSKYTPWMNLFVQMASVTRSVVHDLKRKINHARAAYNFSFFFFFQLPVAGRPIIENNNNNNKCSNDNKWNLKLQRVDAWQINVTMSNYSITVKKRISITNYVKGTCNTL